MTVSVGAARCAFLEVVTRLMAEPEVTIALFELRIDPGTGTGELIERLVAGLLPR